MCGRSNAQGCASPASAATASSPCAPSGDELRGPLGATFLCVKGHFTDGAMQQIAPLLAPDGFVLSLQNGLNEAVIARTSARADGRRVRPLRRGLHGAGPDPARHRADDLHRRTGRAVTPRAEALRETLAHVMPAAADDAISGAFSGASSSTARWPSPSPPSMPPCRRSSTIRSGDASAGGASEAAASATRRRTAGAHRRVRPERLRARRSGGAPPTPLDGDGERDARLAQAAHGHLARSRGQAAQDRGGHAAAAIVQAAASTASRRRSTPPSSTSSTRSRRPARDGLGQPRRPAGECAQRGVAPEVTGEAGGDDRPRATQCRRQAGSPARHRTTLAIAASRTRPPSRP